MSKKGILGFARPENYRKYELDGYNCITTCEYKKTHNTFYAKIGSNVCSICSYFDGELNNNTIICNWSEE